MKFSREQWVFALAGGALVVAGVIGVFSYTHRDPYEGLITHMDVQADEGVRTLARQRIATAQASLNATAQAGEEVDAQMYNAIASDALLLGDLILARESLEKSLAINSLNGTTWSSYGYTLVNMQDYDLARQAYLRAVEMTPMEATYRDAVRILTQQFPEEKGTIKDLYEDSVATLGQKMFNMLGLANWYADAGDCNRAEDHFKVAEDLATNDDVRQQVVEEKETVLAECKTLKTK